ncbi:hypothetical protein C0991_009047 [Blastosporella zonata]|nr:hypothetical protein C0991_009047 [Blastosporella zonata]
MATPADIAKLREIVNSGDPATWDDAWYLQARVTPWDAGESQPPLRELVESGDLKFPRQGRALVPGCGSGYDAVYIASALNLKTLGMDISETALSKAQSLLASINVPAPGKVSFVKGDFFQLQSEEGFDVIYDYTFFVAIPPTRRVEWGSQMASLVKSGGYLITLVWPIDPPTELGPPYFVRVEHYEEVLSEAFEKVLEKVPTTSLPKHVGKERIVGNAAVMLDSSPVVLPSVPRPLKRSASVASLPTPPRTHHKRKHGSRSLRSDDSDTDVDTGSEAEAEKGLKKKQRTNERNEDADEEAFWLDKSDGTTSAAAAPSKKLPSGLVYRRRLAAAASTSSVGSAPVSPPPSNRKAIVAAAAHVTPEPPRRSKRNAALRDSPNNPFLVSPASVAEDSASPTPSPHTPQHQERPTVTYVFRGVRGTFPNPLYDHKRGRPRSPSACSQLPIEHPDYSPDTHCIPKLLFPAAPRKPQAGARKRAGLEMLAEEMLAEEMRNGNSKRGRSVSVSVSGSDEDEEENEERRKIKPKKLDFKAQLLQAGSTQKK